MGHWPMVVASASPVVSTVVASGHGANIWKAYLMKKDHLSSRLLTTLDILEGTGHLILDTCPCSSKGSESRWNHTTFVSLQSESTARTPYVLTIICHCLDCHLTKGWMVDYLATTLIELGKEDLQAVTNLMKPPHNIPADILQKN